MIYVDENIWDFDLHEALNAVSPERREYALRYRHELDQRLCIAVYRLLQRALMQEYGISQCPRFSFAPNGKPMLSFETPMLPVIHFSMSHCRLAVACAVSDKPVGIDVETFDHYDEEVARRVMNDDEMQRILSSPDPAVEFTRLWTMKESLYKMRGDSQIPDVRNMLNHTPHCRFTTTIKPDYALTTSSLTPDS